MSSYTNMPFRALVNVGEMADRTMRLSNANNNSLPARNSEMPNAPISVRTPVQPSPVIPPFQSPSQTFLLQSPSSSSIPPNSNVDSSISPELSLDNDFEGAAVEGTAADSAAVAVLDPNSEYTSIESVFLSGAKHMTTIFAAAFGMTDIANVDNDTRLPSLFKNIKKLDKKQVIPNAVCLRLEVLRRGKNMCLNPIPKPKAWTKEKLKGWLNEKSDSLNDADKEFIKRTIENFFNFQTNLAAQVVGTYAIKRSPKLNLHMFRLWHIFCLDELCHLFVRRDFSVGKDVQDTGAATLLH